MSLSQNVVKNATKLLTKGWSFRHDFRSSERRPTAMPDMTSNSKRWSVTAYQTYITS